MHITVDIIKESKDATLSTVNIDGKIQCFGLEDAYHAVKIPGKTRIPRGVYVVGVRQFGGFHARYSNRFPFHSGMLEVLNVPGFTDILVHIGNYHKDTEGCLLLGLGCDLSSFTLSKSRLAYENFYKKVIASAIAGDLTIEYKDNLGG